LKFFFTAHSAWCPFKKSGNLEVKLRRPEITSCEWKDGEDNAVDKNILGEEARLSVETKDIDDGKTITFKIYHEGADTKKDKPVKILDAPVESNKAEIIFNFKNLQSKPVIDEALYRYYKDQGHEIPREEFEVFLDDYNKDIESDIKKKPKYFYTARAERCADAESGLIEVSKTFKIKYRDAFGDPVKDVKIKVKESDGTEHTGTTDEEGIAEFTDLIPTNNYFYYEHVEQNEEGGE
jgi:hypothetical protein